MPRGRGPARPADRRGVLRGIVRQRRTLRNPRSPTELLARGLRIPRRSLMAAVSVAPCSAIASTICNGVAGHRKFRDEAAAGAYAVSAARRRRRPPLGSSATDAHITLHVRNPARLRCGQSASWMLGTVQFRLSRLVWIRKARPKRSLLRSSPSPWTCCAHVHPVPPVTAPALRFACLFCDTSS